MSLLSLFFRHSEEVDCTVEINNTFEDLSAHVRFDGGQVVYPGDEVLVHGAPISIPYGEKQDFQRTATITRASGLERLWTKMTGDFEMMELCEFSFTERAVL